MGIYNFTSLNTISKGATVKLKALSSNKYEILHHLIAFEVECWYLLFTVRAKMRLNVRHANG